MTNIPPHIVIDGAAGMQQYTEAYRSALHGGGTDAAQTAEELRANIFAYLVSEGVEPDVAKACARRVQRKLQHSATFMSIAARYMVAANMAFTKYVVQVVIEARRKRDQAKNRARLTI